MPAGFSFPSGTEAILAESSLHVAIVSLEESVIFRGAFISSQLFLGLLPKMLPVTLKSKIP